MTADSAALIDDVRSAVARVTDPEYPDLTIEQLGILEAVRIDEDGVTVDLVPTMSGCPALEVIRRDVVDAARSVAGDAVEVRFVDEPRWTPDRIRSDAREVLAREYTITIRPRTGSVVCPVCGSTDVVDRSEFGPARCRSVSWCNSCRNPVEVIRR